MKIIKPKKLEKGDVIGIISPASAPNDLSRIDAAVKYFESIGYHAKVGKNAAKQNGYFAGMDEERLEDVHTMFKDKDVKAIFTTRGGYGSGRLLDKINYSLIKKNPKILVGYSDFTALQLAIFKKCGLITFAGPMAAVDFFGEVDPFTEENLWKILTSKKKIGKILNPNSENFYSIHSGRCEGRLLGGNLSMIVSLLGTKYLPDFKNSIILLEEINEKPYRIDRMFNQLRLANLLDSVKGIILGRFVDCYEKDSAKVSFTLNEVILDYFEKLKIPIIYNVKHGHLKQNLTLPIGIKTKINASRKFIEIPESAVS